MKKRALQALSLSLIVMLLFTMLPAAVSAAEADVRTMEVPKTTAISMTLDGKPSPNEAWELVSWSSGSFYQADGKKPAGCDIRFKAMWTEEAGKAYLWFLIEVADPTLDSTARAWNQDNVRIFIDEDGVNEDSATPVRDKSNYNELYYSSEFMAYFTHGYKSQGFEWKGTKKADQSGYYVEVKYTFGDAANAAAGKQLRAQLAAVWGIDAASCAQYIWSKDTEKWNAGNRNKEAFAHAGVLTLSDKLLTVDALPTMEVLRTNAADMTLDGAVTPGEAWDGASWNTRAFKQLGTAEVPEGVGIRFKTLWATDENGAYLYFLIDIDDPTLDSTSRAWNKDNVRIFLDEDGINEDNVKITSKETDYGGKFVSSEFMSYVEHSFNAPGFTYKAAKRADGTGYTVEVQYTFGTASLAVPDATVRANIAAIWGEASVVEFIWSSDMSKWSGAGLNNKEYFAHTGTLKLSGTQAEIPSAAIRMDGVQTASVTSANGFDARLVASVSAAELENAEQIDFIVSATYVQNNTLYTVSAKTYTVNTVFEAFLADSKTISAAEGEVFALILIKDIPADVTVTLTVTPRIVYKNAGTATGKTVTCTLPTV